MKDINNTLIKDRIEQYAGKYIADHEHTWMDGELTNEVLEKTYRECVIPAKAELYPHIRERIIEKRGSK
jgi:two-component SAPR family response regulator